MTSDKEFHILLDVTNYLDWTSSDSLPWLPGQEARLTDGLDLAYDVSTGFENVFGGPHVDFHGSHADLVELVNRFEEDEEMRPDLIDDIAPL
jgi:hypothetical protein